MKTENCSVLKSGNMNVRLPNFSGNTGVGLAKPNKLMVASGRQNIIKYSCIILQQTLHF